ncbi:MAG: asparagine synthase (glutamine-hydrolyzing) [Gammaproteobacteria bacterium]|nr:MAG: asparagine synthase (glutamine-hydrolyzing) [Gammaproteobacteria bacterium]
MCGISGIYELRGGCPSIKTIEEMTDAMIHRGPDGRGVWVKGPVALGHRRLSIIDIKGGEQPMLAMGGAYALTFNGEIYNYLEIREELEKTGVVFRTNSDTEVLLQALIKWGSNALPKLNGMFAFAFWDSARNIMLLARDHLGIKPLYYHVDPDRLLFASDLTAIVCHPAFERKVDMKALSHFMTWRVVPYPYSIYEGIRQVSPGGFIEVDGDGRVTQERYWDIPLDAPVGTKTDQEYREELEGLIQDALRLQVRSDVPVGAFLSGGVDSSTVAYYMMSAQQGKGNTFTIGFGDAESDFDERRWAKDVSRHIGSRHFEHMAKAYEIEPLLDAVTWYYGQPNGTGLPNYFVSAMARQHVKVALAGIGPDECFAGYRRFLAATKPFIFPYGGDSENIFLRSLVSFTPQDKKSLFTDDVYESVKEEDSIDFIRRQNSYLNGVNELNKLCCLDLRHYMLNDLLFNLDKMSMAHSLEVRVPLLDYRIVEFAMTVPEHLKIRNWEQKVLMKQVMYPRLPKHVFLRKKHGFSLPKEAWMLRVEAFIRDVLCKNVIERRGLMRWSSVSQLMDEVFNCNTRVSWRAANNLWNVFAFELWAQKFIDVSHVPTTPPNVASIEFG